MNNLLLRAAVLLFLLAPLAACGDTTPAGIPPLPTSDIAVVLPTASLPVEVIPAPATKEIDAAATITPSVTVTATAVVTATVQPAALTALQALNIRSGPGLEYPVVGWLAAGAEVEIIGRSPDSGWWRISCPAGLQTEQCWVIGSETLAQAVYATAVATAPVPPAPLPTAEPTPTPCVAVRPAGWVSYEVRSGDTLSGIAGATGTSVAALLAANCLASDVIVAGGAIWVPGAPSAPDQPPVSNLATQPPVPVPIPAGVAPALQYVSDPALGGCPRVVNLPSSETFAMTITDSLDDFPLQPRTTWQALETVCIFLSGVSADAVEPTVTLVRPGGATESLAIALVPDTTALGNRRKGLAIFLMDRAQGSFRVIARQEGIVHSAEVQATAALEPRLLLDPLIDPGGVAPGEPVRVFHTGFPHGTSFYLYGFRGNADQPCQQLELAQTSVSAESYCVLGRVASNLPVSAAVSALTVDAAQLVPGGAYLVDSGLVTSADLSMPQRFQVKANAP